MPKILITISNEFEEIEAISIIDICRRANIKVTIAGVEGLEISGAHGIKIISDELKRSMCDTPVRNFREMVKGHIDIFSS